KVAAISCIVLAVGLSAGLLIDNLTVRLIVVAVGLIGVWYVGYQVPTRETILAQQCADVVEPNQGTVAPPAER
ncbi:MAG: hypothetical protein AAFO29_20350, partial [Actinomycetota bacterium]